LVLVHLIKRKLIVDILLTLFLVLLNGFFVAAEFAIVKVRSSRIELLANSGSKPALMAKHIIHKLDAYLSATQLGITLASLGLGWIGESVVARMIINLFHALNLTINEALAHSIALPIAFAIITVLHIVFGELAPKSIAIQRSESTTLAIAYPLNVFYYLFRPIIWLLNGFANFVLKLFGITPVSEQEVHSPEELRYLVEQGSESGNMQKINYEIISNAFDFSERTARQVMVPRTQIVALNIDQAEGNVLEKVIDEGFSRVPVYRNTIDNIIGVIYIKDLLIALRKKEPVEVKSLLRQAHYIPESKKISDILAEFQKKHFHMAVVVNEYGGTEGIITLEDIVEELVGEIQDEYDNEVPVVEPVAEGVFKVVTAASIADINEHLPHPLPEGKDYDSLGGLIIAHLGKIPEVNEKLEVEGYEISVLKKIGSKILLAELHTLKNQELNS
jgi:CBS domain containing-hemolysin-like protein